MRPISAPLQNTDLVVETLNKTQRDFILRLTKGSDAVPVSINHQSELFVTSQTLQQGKGLSIIRFPHVDSAVKSTCKEFQSIEDYILSATEMVPRPVLPEAG